MAHRRGPRNGSDGESWNTGGHGSFLDQFGRKEQSGIGGRMHFASSVVHPPSSEAHMQPPSPPPNAYGQQPLAPLGYQPPAAAAHAPATLAPLQHSNASHPVVPPSYARGGGFNRGFVAGAPAAAPGLAPTAATRGGLPPPSQLGASGLGGGGGASAAQFDPNMFGDNTSVVRSNRAPLPPIAQPPVAAGAAGASPVSPGAEGPYLPHPLEYDGGAPLPNGGTAGAPHGAYGADALDEYANRTKPPVLGDDDRDAIENFFATDDFSDQFNARAAQRRAVAATGGPHQLAGGGGAAPAHTAVYPVCHRCHQTLLAANQQAEKVARQAPASSGTGVKSTTSHEQIPGAKRRPTVPPLGGRARRG